MTQLLYIIVPFVISLLLGFYVIPRMVMISIKDNWGRNPDEMTGTSFKAVKIGGLSVFPVLLITLCTTLMVPMCAENQALSVESARMVPRVIQLITGSTLLFIVGLKYDMHGASSFIRLLAIIVAAGLLPLSKVYISNLHGLFGIYEIPTWLGITLTIGVASFIIEMFKLLDGMDGLESSIGLSVLSLLFLLGFSIENMTPSVVTAAMLGVLLVYWIMKMFRKEWNKGIMGNSGSYILGYIVAYLVIIICMRSGNVYRPGTGILACSVVMLPACDIIRVIANRSHEGRSIISPDRNQLNHKLFRMGMPHWLIILVIMLLPVFFSVVTAFLLWQEVNSTLVIVLSVAMVVVVEMIISWGIKHHEHKTHQSMWDKVYGEDAWNANVPYEQIRAKQLAFGDMDLASRYIQGDETEFIPDGMSAFERNVKRFFDILLSGVCLVVFSPLFLLSYILIKLDDGGPVIYRQERIGRYGRPFTIYKYRSMRQDAEDDGPQLSHSNGEDDPRLTRVGCFLRAYHLDELPQLWNVFVGDMAFIGYRPERQVYIDKIMEHDPRYAFLYQIRPGVTSYATLYNGYTDTMEKMLRRLELDLYYLGHRSWWFDIKLLFLTFFSIIFGKKF